MTLHRFRSIGPFGLLSPLAFAFATVACASPGASVGGATGEATGVKGDTVILTEADADAQTVDRSVAVGAVFQVRLPTQPGTGFSWAVTSEPAIAQPVPPASIDPAGIPGGVETRVFSFRAGAAGVYRLRFSYSQPWAGGTKDAKVLTYTITAR